MEVERTANRAFAPALLSPFYAESKNTHGLNAWISQVLQLTVDRGRLAQVV
jgi:hypothetical protein